MCRSLDVCLSPLTVSLSIRRISSLNGSNIHGVSNAGAGLCGRSTYQFPRHQFRIGSLSTNRDSTFRALHDMVHTVREPPEIRLHVPQAAPRPYSYRSIKAHINGPDPSPTQTHTWTARDSISVRKGFGYFIVFVLFIGFVLMFVQTRCDF